MGARGNHANNARLFCTFSVNTGNRPKLSSQTSMLHSLAFTLADTNNL